MKITVSEPFSFEENVNYLSDASDEILLRIHEGRIYKALAIGDITPVIEITAEPDGTLGVRFLGGTEPERPEDLAAVERFVRDWFDLDTDLRPFYKLAQADPLLRHAVQSFYGLRNVGIPDLFEAICWGIIGQQINLAFAYTLKRRLVEAYGRAVECEGETYWLFPTPQRIAALSVEEMANLRMTAKKCEYIIGIARLIVEGKLSKTMLLAAGDAKQAEKMLVQIRGIGPWTANYVLMRCLRMPSAFPIDDVGLHNSIKHLQGADKKPTRDELLQLSAAWTNWESYATFYLWRVLY